MSILALGGRPNGEDAVDAGAVHLLVRSSPPGRRDLFGLVSRGCALLPLAIFVLSLREECPGRSAGTQMVDCSRFSGPRMQGTRGTRGRSSDHMHWLR